jgi:hypothetical protein
VSLARSSMPAATAAQPQWEVTSFRFAETGSRLRASRDRRVRVITMDRRSTVTIGTSTVAFATNGKSYADSPANATIAVEDKEYDARDASASGANSY